jgi:replication-associated recombination protein RarA
LFTARPRCPYQYSEVISAIRKDVKLGNVENAIYWATVIREFSPRWETAHRIVAKQLWISAAEDVDDPAVVLRAFALFQKGKEVPETEHIIFLIAQMCAARKY